jgi:hypothetical protein
MCMCCRTAMPTFAVPLTLESNHVRNTHVPQLIFDH